MKNEPVVSYNHMEEDNSTQNFYGMKDENRNLPISLYMIFAVDIILMGVIAFLAFQIIF